MTVLAKPDIRTRAAKLRAETQEEMRAKIRARRYWESIDNDLSREIRVDELPVVQFKTQTRLKLLGKVLPDLSATQLTGADGGPIQTAIRVSFASTRD